MASLTGVIKHEMELRPCSVHDSKALFHGWFEKSERFTERKSITVFGIVEYEDGFVKKVSPREIKFTDGKVSGHYSETIPLIEGLEGQDESKKI